VLKAALAAAASDKHDTLKLIHQHHLEEGIRDVVAGKRVMQQSLFNDHPSPVSRSILETAGLVPAQTAMYALAMAGVALLLALVALLMVLLR
jgi:hypothetical protein